MKTVYKVIILILFAIGAITGVFIFAKTQVAPPESVEPVDQYSKALLTATGTLNSVSGDIDAQRAAYLALDDKINRYLAENVVAATQADKARKTIDDTYGGQLTTFGFTLFSQSAWPDSEIKKLVAYMDELGKDKLTTGETAAPQTFFTKADELKGIAMRYDEARALSKRTWYGAVDSPEARSASSESAMKRLDAAQKYMVDNYLKNNVALMESLQDLPKQIGKSHYKKVTAIFNQVNINRYYWESEISNISVKGKKAKEDYKSKNYSQFISIDEAYDVFLKRVQYVYDYKLYDNELPAPEAAPADNWE